MGNHRLNAWFHMLKGLGKSRRNHKISEVPTNEHQQQLQPPPPSSTSASSFVPSSSSSSSSSSSGAVPATSSNHLGLQPYFSYQRKSYYFTRNLSPPPPATILSNDNTSTRSTTRRCASSHVSKPPREPSSSPKKKRVAPAVRRNRRSSKSDHRPSPRLVSTSVLSGCKASATIESLLTKSDSAPQVYPNSAAETCSDNDSIVPEISSSRTLSPETLDSMLSWSSVSCSCRVDNKQQMAMDAFDPVSDFRLPPIRTNITRKSSAAEDMKDSKNYINEATKLSSVGAAVKEEEILSSSASSYILSRKEERRTRPAAGATRRVFVNNSSGAGGGGLKLRTNSPRIIGNKKRILNQAGKSFSSSISRRWSRGRGRGKRRSVSESMAVVKTSKDPRRDFRASMVEMIVENNICASKDLEDLLACYLCLNSNEYHELIIGVFREIWFDLVDIRPS